MFVHYDSVSGSCNEKIARKVAAKVWATFGYDETFLLSVMQSKCLEDA